MVSIRDVAKMAGVSAASVSRVLNNDPNFSINKNTRQRIINVANQLHYSKKASGNSHRDNSEMTIGLILRHSNNVEIKDPYFYDIRRGIELEAGKWRLHVVKAFEMRDPDKDWAQLTKYGAVIMISEMTADAVEKVYKLNPNLILVDNYTNDSRYDIIQTDFSEKMQETLDLLYAYGHRKIAFIGGQSSKVKTDGTVERSRHEVRAESYQRWMKLHDLQQYIDVRIGRWSSEDGLRLTEQLINKEQRPTAIVVGSDPMALGVYKAINNSGLSIPNDISVVSFDDSEMNRYLTPTLSSVRMEAEEMGRTAVRLARNRMLGKNKMSLRIVCASKLKVRDSIKRI